MHVETNTCQQGLTRFTCFHGTHRKFYFCVRCSHTLCPLTRTNIEGHHALYWLLKNGIYANMFCLNFFHLWMWINITFASDICMHLVKCVKIWSFHNNSWISQLTPLCAVNCWSENFSHYNTRWCTTFLASNYQWKKLHIFSKTSN